MIGQRFNKWTVLAEVNKPKQHCKYYECRCDCGTISIIPGTTLRLKKSKQCRKCSFHKHNMTGTTIYKIWVGILSRCYNTKVRIYKYYGGKGIIVCDRWRSFENFYKDMGDRPDKMQIDRIDNNGPYDPENCRWVTAKENNPANKGDLKDDMPGKRFGKWLVGQRIKHKPDHWYYECTCDCGNKRIISGGELRRGNSTQCINCKNEAHKGWHERYKIKT